MIWEKTAKRRDRNHLTFRIWCALCERLYGNSITGRRRNNYRKAECCFHNGDCIFLSASCSGIYEYMLVYFSGSRIQPSSMNAKKSIWLSAQNTEELVSQPNKKEYKHLCDSWTTLFRLVEYSFQYSWFGDKLWCLQNIPNCFEET